MSTSIVQLNDSTLAAVRREADKLYLELSPAFVVKSIPDSEDTLWRQNGRIVLTDPEVDGELPATPAPITTSRIRLNQYAYVDMLPIPSESPGFIEVKLSTENGGPVTIQAEFLLLELDDVAKYIRHL